MKNYIFLVLAFVVFVIAFNSIEGSRQDKIHFKQIQQETKNCEEKGTVLYIEPGNKNVCVPRRKKP